MIDVGLAGCGYWGSKHLRVLNELPGCAWPRSATTEAERCSSSKGMLPADVHHPTSTRCWPAISTRW